jgi:hypothetical protein
MDYNLITNASFYNIKYTSIKVLIIFVFIFLERISNTFQLFFIDFY